jgi:hypothetical protein
LILFIHISRRTWGLSGGVGPTAKILLLLAAFLGQ